jgi:hypothetical protein
MQATAKHKGVAREAERYALTGVPTSTWYDLQNEGKRPSQSPWGRAVAGG